MSDETATIVEQQPEPGGWLAEHQRAHCAGGSALDTYQGLIADEIYLPQSAADHTDPLQLVLACNAWTDAMLNQAHFIAGEFAPEALWSFHAHDYCAQAKAGGQLQYYALRGGDEIALRCTQSALKSMLADPHLDLFNLLVRLKRAKPVTARRIATQAGYRNPAAALRDLDKRFAELELKEPLTQRHKTWLKSLRKVKVVPDADMDGHLNRVASANRFLAARRGEADALRRQREQTDPAFRCARKLCEMAGLQFAGLRAGGFAPMRSVWAEGPDRTGFLFRVETDRGPRAAMFYADGGLFKRRMAVLLEQGGALPIGSMEVSRADFAAIVPNGG